MGNFKWLQFSDLHFRRHDSFDMSMAREALLSCLSEEKFKCDYIFITGDIANQNSYDSASEYMEKLLEITNVGKENVVWAVGNHDIKRGSPLRESIIDRIRKAKNPSQEFEATMADAEERSLLTYSGMSDYLKQYEDLFGRKLTADETSDAHVFYSLKHLSLVVLNTCLTSCDNEDEHRLMITEHRLHQIFDKVDDKNKPLVVIGHHGKGFFYNSEQEKLAQLFDNAGVDMYLCGHSHRLGYARFDDAGRDIPQITCGGGLVDGYSVVSFMLGEYDDAARTVRITPYSYSDRGSRQFQKDYSLHRRLTESNNTFALERLGAATFAADDKRVSLADKDLFERSKRYYNFLRGEKGRFSFLELSEELFPDAKPFDTFLLGECEDQPQKLMEVLKNKPGSMIIVGEGGTGKTTALLNVWQELLAGGTELPLYVPLNEYKPQPEFLRNYIKLYYEKIDITGLARKCVLLLDGLNEISGDALPLVQEIKALLLQSEHVRIIVTSRSRFEPEHQLDKPFALYNLQPLDMGTVESFLQRNNLSLEKDLGEVLQTPLMLTLYAQTSSVQKRVAQRKLFEFKPYEKRGELLYNYLLCQIANCVIHGRLEDIIPTWCALFAVAPYIAHHMESRSQFQIGKNEFAELLSSFVQMYTIEQQLSDMPLGIKGIIEKHKLREKAAVPVENVLLYQQYLLVEEGDFYIFRHQYFRDFFSALRIANVIRESLCTEPFVLPSEAKEAWSVYVKDMLGDYYGDYRNRAAYKLHTPMHELLGKMRGMPCLETGWAINNIIETWRSARDGKIIGEDLSRLDLSRVPLNGVFFSNYKATSRFDGCVISDTTIMPQGHSSGVNSAAYSPDGRRVLSASFDGTFKEWDRESGQCLHTFEGHSSGVSSAAYGTDRHRVLSASYDNTVKEWDRESGQCLRTFKGHSSSVSSAAYSPDGCRVLSASFDGTIKEWDRESGQCLRTFEGHSSSVNSAVYSPDGCCMLSASSDGTIKEWDRESGQCLRTFVGHSGWVHSAVYSADGHRVLSASSDGTVKEWDRESGQCLRTIEGHSAGVCSAAYSPDGHRVLSSSSDGTVKEWDRESGQCLRTLEGHSAGVCSAAYSPDGHRVLSASSDRTFKEWDRESEQCLRTFKGHSDWVYSVGYSSDGYNSASASSEGYDNTLKEWDRESGQCLWTMPPFSGVFIAGCDFKGCRFSSKEIERLVHTYGGNVLSPMLHSIHSETLRGEQRTIDISLGGEPVKSLLIAGPNGSGKSSLLAGINQAVEAVLRNEAAKEVAVAFSDKEPAEAERILRQEHGAGYYLFKYFQAKHSFMNVANEMPSAGKKRKDFWTLLEGMHAEINQLRLDGNHEGADSLEMWLGRISESFESLFAGEVKLRREKGGYHVDRVFEGRVQELNLDHLPDGYSAIIDIFSAIIAHWRDDIIPFNHIRGLVLIDELESHLHVRLQKHVLPFLTELLPGIQFIVATHSPYVLNSVANAVVYDMDKDEMLEAVALPVL